MCGRYASFLPADWPAWLGGVEAAGAPRNNEARLLEPVVDEAR